MDTEAGSVVINPGNADGKEGRFPVILTLREKEIARRIVMVFKQQVCGFDLLRVQEVSLLTSSNFQFNNICDTHHSVSFLPG